jgi:dihydrofolate synthase/folylpolyglutamate synthase
VDVLAHAHGFAIEPEMANDALAGVQFPGRMEVIQQNPTVILDGAHNPQKTLALSRSMAELYPDTRFTLICGMLQSKDASQSLRPLLPGAKRVVTVKPQVLGRNRLEASHLAETIRGIGYTGALDVLADVTQALDLILPKAGAEDVILVTGSLYMVGEARNYWVKPETLLIEAELNKDPLCP